MMHTPTFADKLTLAEFAALAGPVTTTTVRRWTQKRSDCPKPQRLANGHLVFDRCEVERFLEQREDAA